MQPPFCWDKFPILNSEKEFNVEKAFTWEGGY